MRHFRTRFALSPTGFLHLGHAYSALTGWRLAEAGAGEWLLRIEDLDGSRARPEFEAAIFEDLDWLGLRWPEPVLRQSDHLARYDAALSELAELGLTYPCSCTRADIRAAQGAPQSSGEAGSGNLPAPYPGTCRGRPMASRRADDAIRLDLGRALRLIEGRGLTFEESGPLHPGRHRVDPMALRRCAGDVVLARRDTRAAAYHLAVVVDDAWQGITHVVRGDDLWDATPLHRLLQALLGLPAPVWHHHDLVRDENGRRLAKRDGARALRSLRESGTRPDQLRERLGFAGQAARL